MLDEGLPGVVAACGFFFTCFNGQSDLSRQPAWGSWGPVGNIVGMIAGISVGMEQLTLLEI